MLMPTLVEEEFLYFVGEKGVRVRGKVACVEPAGLSAWVVSSPEKDEYKGRGTIRTSTPPTANNHTSPDRC